MIKNWNSVITAYLTLGVLFECISYGPTNFLLHFFSGLLHIFVWPVFFVWVTWPFIAVIIFVFWSIMIINQINFTLWKDLVVDLYKFYKN